jgi:O-antigen/teichoic acid export membrane protein
MKRTALNLVSVIGGETLLRGANFLAVVVIARLYGAGELGLYATALAYATVAVMIAENGLQISSITEIKRTSGDIHGLVSQLWTLRISLFAVMSVILALIGWFSQWSKEVWTIGILVTARVLLYSYSQLQFSVLKSIDRMRVIGPIQTLNFFILTLGIAATYHYSWNIKVLLWGFIVAQVTEIVLSFRVLWRWGLRPARFVMRECWSLLKRSTPIGMTYVLAGLMMRTDIIVLSALGSRSDVGHFAAAHMGVVLFYSLSWLFGSVLLTDFTRLASDPSKFDGYAARWTKMLLSAGGVGALALYFVAPPAVLFLFGNDFAITARLASIMILALPLILLNAVYLSRAIAIGAKWVYLGAYLGTSAVAITLDILLARAYGGVGVAFAIVARELLIFFIFRIQATVSSRRSMVIAELSYASQVEEAIDV